MVIFINDEIDRRMLIIEDKLRNSFSAVKVDNNEIKQRIEAISNDLKKSTLSKDLADLSKKVVANDDSFRKFKNEMARDSLRKDVVKEVLPIFNEKFKTELKVLSNENNAMRKDLNSFKSKWISASESKLNAGLEAMRANFKKLSEEVNEAEVSNIRLFEKQNSHSRSEIKAIKKSTSNGIAEQNRLIDQYSAKLEDYSGELEVGYSQSKREILASAERKFNALKAQNDEEIRRLQGQIAYIKGRVNANLGKEKEPKIPFKTVSKQEVKNAVKVKNSVERLFGNLMDGLSSGKLVLEKDKPAKPVKVAKVEVKKPVFKVQDKKDRNIFSNLISLLADESPEMKVDLKVAKKAVKKEAKKVEVIPVKKLETKEGEGFFNSIIKSLSD